MHVVSMVPENLLNVSELVFTLLSVKPVSDTLSWERNRSRATTLEVLDICHRHYSKIFRTELLYQSPVYFGFDRKRCAVWCHLMFWNTETWPGMLAFSSLRTFRTTVLFLYQKLQISRTDIKELLENVVYNFGVICRLSLVSNPGKGCGISKLDWARPPVLPPNVKCFPIFTDLLLFCRRKTLE